jgi:hypothetical protein
MTPSMTGPENYAEALRLVRHSRGEEPAFAAVTLQQAQVHATLALAAATALSTVSDEAPMDEFQAWQEVAGVKGARPAVPGE